MKIELYVNYEYDDISISKTGKFTPISDMLPYKNKVFYAHESETDLIHFPESYIKPYEMLDFFKRVVKSVEFSESAIRIVTNSYFLMQEYDLYFLKNKDSKISHKVYYKVNESEVEESEFAQDLEHNEIYDYFASLFTRGVEIK